MPCSWSTQEFCPLIHTTREAELSKEQSEGASRLSRAVLHVRRDGQESLSTARLLPHDGPDVSGHAHVGQCRNLTPSSCPRASREPEPARGHGQRHTAVTQAEDPWVIEVFGDTTITLDIGLACADAYAVLARKGAKAAVVMDHRDTVAGVLVDSDHVACGATRHLGGQETDDCSCASDVHQAEGQTQTTAVAPLGCVGDFMRPCQITVTGDTLLSEAASTMADYGLPWLPVWSALVAGHHLSWRRHGPAERDGRRALGWRVHGSAARSAPGGIVRSEPRGGRAATRVARGWPAGR